jgi:gluconokinase
MPQIPGLRSPYAKIGRLVYFGRMLDKIRLNAAGKLPPEYQANIGDSKPGMFDARCCGFLRVSYEEIKRHTLEGAGDADVLDWAEKKGGRRTDEECAVWNQFMMKRGWHDPAENVKRLRERIKESGLESKQVETFFDYIDFDEGRDPVAARSWESV